MSHSQALKPAFPVPHHHNCHDECGSHGMTLRDYFASHALIGLLSATTVDPDANAAIVAYQLADYMLEQSEPPEPS